MRIAVNARHATGRDTGVPNYVRALYKAILAADRGNDYLFLQPRGPAVLGKTEYGRVPAGLLGDAWFDSWTACTLARRHRADVLHGPAHVLPVKKPRGMRYVLTVHDVSFRVFPEMYESYLRAYYGFAIGHSLRLADVVVADSHSTRADIIRFYGTAPDRIRVVPLGIDADYLQPVEAPRLIAQPYFLSLMTHQKRKNIDGVLAAIAASPKLKALRYVIAGGIDPKHFADLKQRIAAKGLSDCVQLCGYVPKADLINLYRHAEFFIYPSFYEGFGLPVLEAMACGCPVITSNNSSLPEIVRDATWLVDPRDIGAMADKMLELLQLPASTRNELVQAGTRFAGAFTWDRTAQAMIDVFRTVLG